MTDRSAKLRLGGFVAAGLAGISGLVVLFGGAPAVFSDRAAYTVSFDEAPNVGPGTPVRKSGVRIGRVTDVDLDDATGKVRVRIEVGRKFLPRKSDDATIFRGILSGDTSIDFVPKADRTQPISTTVAETVAPGTDIEGVTPLNPNKFLQQASGVLPSAQESMARMLASVERFERAVPKVEKAFDEIAGLARSGRELVPELRQTNQKVQDVLAFNDPPGNDPDNPQGLKATLAEIRDFVKTVKPLAEDLRRILKTNEADIAGTVKAVRGTTEAVNDLLNPDNRKSIAGLLKNLDAASDDLTKTVRLAAILLDRGETTLKTINARLDEAGPLIKKAEGAFANVEKATRPIADNAEPLMKNAAAAADQLAKTLADLRQTVQLVNRSDGTLNKVLSDPALYQNLNEATVSLARTLQRAEKVAADLQVFADKIARRPESLGVGGAIRPNTGLKESPNAVTPQPIAPLPPSGLFPSYRPDNGLPPR